MLALGLNLGKRKGAAWTPASIAGLSLWYDATQLAGLANNDPVATWTDASGNANNATQGTASARPTYKTNVQNSKPAVLFDGVDDFMSFAALPLDSWVGVVLKGNGLRDLDGIIGRRGTDNGVRWRSAGPSWEAVGPFTKTYNSSDIAASSCQLVELTNNQANYADSLGGYFLAGGRDLSGYVLEVVVATSTPDAATIANWRAYVVAKWAMTP